MKTVYYTAIDSGDGSLRVEFFDSKECITLLEEYDLEGARGEGGGSFQVEGEITGLTIGTIEDVREYLTDMGWLEEDE